MYQFLVTFPLVPSFKRILSPIVIFCLDDTSNRFINPTAIILLANDVIIAPKLSNANTDDIVAHMPMCNVSVNFNDLLFLVDVVDYFVFIFVVFGIYILLNEL